MNTRRFFIITMAIIILVLFFRMSIASAAVFDVDNGPELFDALLEAGVNEEDDVVNLAAGVYELYIPSGDCYGGFVYGSSEEEPHSLTIQGAPGTSPDEIILDTHHDGPVLRISDHHRDYDLSPESLPSINVIGITIQNGYGPYYPGGLQLHGYSHDVTVRNCNIFSNTSNYGYGGGVHIVCDRGRLTFENNLVTGNQVYERDVTTSHGPDVQCEGAGVNISFNGGEEAVIRNNIIASNFAYGDYGEGGGLWLENWHCGLSGSTLHVANNTIVNNSARYGGGLFVLLQGTLNLHNNIIHGSGSPVDDPVPSDLIVTEWEDGDTVYAYHNNFSTVLADLDEDVGNMDVEPEFVGSYHLPDGSPLIDAGTEEVPCGLLETDFEGDPRIYMDLPDIGADEWCGEIGAPPPLPRPVKVKDPYISRTSASEATDHEIQVFIGNYDSTFSAKDTIYLACEHGQGGLNSPRVVLVDAVDHRTVHTIAHPRTGAPTTHFYMDWNVDPSIPSGDYKIFVEQPGYFVELLHHMKQPKRSQQIESLHGYSRAITIINVNNAELETFPMGTNHQAIPEAAYEID